MPNRILLALCLLPSCLFSQEVSIDSVESLYDLAIEFKRERDFKQAWALFHDCENLYKSQNDWEGYFSCRKQHARFVRDVDRDPFGARRIQDSCIKAIQLRFGPDHPELAEIYGDLAGTVMLFSRSREGLQYFLESLRIRALVFGPRSERVAVTHLNLAYLYRHEFQWQESLEQALLAKEMLEDAGSQQTSFYRQTLQAISLAYKGLGKLEQAIPYSEKVVELVKIAFPDREDKWVSYLLDLASIYRDGHLEGLAESTYRRIRRIIESAGGEDSRTYAKVLYQQGNFFLSRGNLAEGYPALVTATQLFQQRGNSKGADYAMGLSSLARHEQKEGNYAKARDYLNRSIAAMYWGTDDGTVNAQHDPWTIQNPTLYLSAQFDLIRLQQIESERSDNPVVVLDSALTTLHMLVDLLDYVRLTIANEADKKSWFQYQTRVYEQGIVIASQCIALQPESIRFKEEMFFFSDRSRANLMQDLRLLDPAHLSLRYPTPLWKELSSNKDQLAFCKTRLQKAVTSRDTATISNLRILRSRLLIKQDSLLLEVESNYPMILTAGFRSRKMSLKEVQQSLEPHQVLLEYFWGTDSLYLISITDREITTQSLGKTEKIGLLVKQYLALLTSPEMEQAGEPLVRVGKELFQTILPNGEAWKAYSSWILIPDGKLSYLPFDAIAIGQKENSIEYLLHHVSCRTIPSASYLHKASRRESSAKSPFVGFAPNFSQQDISLTEPSFARNKISRLYFNQQELVAINELTNGTVLLDSEATKSAYMMQAPSCRILHLATHALADDEFPDKSGLLFHSEQHPLAYEILSSEEIESLPLSAQLAVLSACLTGTGQLLRGEGILSLSRSFQIAGCPSVVMSLWTVDDAATRDLMKSFYEFLDQKHSIEQALRLAKLQYIESHDLNHPYFWASFSLIGEDQNIDLPQHSKSIFILLFIGMALVITACVLVVKRGMISKKMSHPA